MVQNKQEDANNNINSNNVQATSSGSSVGSCRLVGWAVDTTGRRLIDEICQMAAYSPMGENVTPFSQYIMPFADLNMSFQRRHSIRIITTGRYRMLKDLRQNKFVKTKSDISALSDFVQWLEDLHKQDENLPLVLVYHEDRKAGPPMLLEILRRYCLLERFQKVVYGFCNIYNVAEDRCPHTGKVFHLRALAKVLLGTQEEDYSSAVARAKSSYDIAVNLAQDGNSELTSKDKEFMEVLSPYTTCIADEEKDIAKTKALLEVQNTFKPVFGALLRASPMDRVYATRLRRILAENNLNCDKLKMAYEEGAKEGLDKLLKTQIANAKESDLNELLDILDCFFDPEKKPVQPKVPRFYNYRGQHPNNRRPTNQQRRRKGEKRSEGGSSSANSSANNSNIINEGAAETSVVSNTPTNTNVVTTECDNGNGDKDAIACAASAVPLQETPTITPPVVEVQ